jgi:hypothetical protein
MLSSLSPQSESGGISGSKQFGRGQVDVVVGHVEINVADGSAAHLAGQRLYAKRNT